MNDLFLDNDLDETEVELEYAGFWTRFLAAFIDGLILIIPSTVINLILPLLGSMLASWLYSALQESGANQATVGKRAMGIMVVDLDGEPISFGQATGRHFGKLVSSAILLIGFFIQPFTEKKQVLHEIMAGTLVVKGKV